MRVYKGGLSYKEAWNLPLTELFKLQKWATKIDHEESRAIKKGH